MKDLSQVSWVCSYCGKSLGDRGYGIHLMSCKLALKAFDECGEEFKAVDWDHLWEEARYKKVKEINDEKTGS